MRTGFRARLGRLRHAIQRPPDDGAVRPAPGYDSWLEQVAGDELARIDAAFAAGRADGLAAFRGLDTDLWALLLTLEYDAYPHLRAALPDVPDLSLQQQWTGVSGAALAAQSAAFTRRLYERFAQHGARPLSEATVLDFGCGWGRLTRMVARDVPRERLFGCDPSQDILDVCRDTGVPARFARSEFLPDRIPFDEQFDVAFAFSVFTHLSEPAHERCLRALHAALRPGGVLVVTVRPPSYLGVSADAGYAFVPHPGEMTYGEAVITVPYVRERWSEMFALLDADILLDDLFQVMLTLRRA
jgi:2-polyprenyl-3-methyl-5-hydroxy-6-metoxy-1,4-benzoquinol methylase